MFPRIFYWLSILLAVLLLSSCLQRTAPAEGESDDTNSESENSEENESEESNAQGANEEEEEEEASVSVTPATSTINVSRAGYPHQVSSLPSSVRLSAATLLNDGRVMVTGGRFSSAIVGQIYYDFSRIYTMGGASTVENGSVATVSDMNFARYDHALVTLANGKVLVLGGYNGGGAVASAEVYDPDTDTYTTISQGGCVTALTGSVRGVRLGNGKVLVVTSSNGTAELFDPDAGTDGCFSTTDTMANSRNGFSLTLLTNGKVLVAGGGTATAELYDPDTATFSSTAENMNSTRSSHGAARLANGKVLIVGGYNGAFARLSTAELFDPTDESFTATADTLEVARVSLSVGAFTSGNQNGNALVIGGTADGGSSNGIRQLELYDTASDAFITLSAEMSEFGVTNHSTVSLSDGARIFVANGWQFGSDQNYVFNTQVGGVTFLSASGGTGPYTYSTSPSTGNISSTTWALPATSTSCTLSAEDSADNTGSSTITIDAGTY